MCPKLAKLFLAQALLGGFKGTFAPLRLPLVRPVRSAARLNQQTEWTDVLSKALFLYMQTHS